MARKTTEGCCEIDLKLDELYAHCKLHPALTPNITGPTALAAAMGIGRTTIFKWQRRNKDTDRDAWQVSPDHITKLARLLVEVTPGTVTLAEATRLWRTATATEFKRRLVARDSVSIGGLLEAREPLLKVNAARVETGGFNMVEVELDPVEGELVLLPGQYFAVLAGARKGRTLVVLGESPSGWFLLAPSPDYHGVVAHFPERVPAKSPGWTIKAPSGPHRIIVIELPGGSAPIERKRGQTLALLPEQERTLVEELLDVNRSGEWRWGEARLFMEKSHAGL